MREHRWCVKGLAIALLAIAGFSPWTASPAVGQVADSSDSLGKPVLEVADDGPRDSTPAQLGKDADGKAKKADGSAADSQGDLSGQRSPDAQSSRNRNSANNTPLFGNGLGLFANASARPNTNDRLASTPRIFGDFLPPPIMISDTFGSHMNNAGLALPSCGMKIAENNGALPEDRVYALFNHYEGAFDSTFTFPNTGPHSYANTRRLAVDQYTLGFEKTFFDDVWSIGMRMPIYGCTTYPSAAEGNPYPWLADMGDATGSQQGNLLICAKRLLCRTDSFALSAGVGVEVPTAGDSIYYGADDTSTTLHNGIVHLSPFVSFVNAYDSGWFTQGFAQLDVPLGEDSIDTTLPFPGIAPEGYRASTCLYLDAAVGRWLYHNPGPHFLTGVAAVAEFHYATALQSDDQVVIYQLSPSMPPYMVYGNGGRLNGDFTVGLHNELFNNTLARVGYAFPLSAENNRTFDGEVILQVERRF